MAQIMDNRDIVFPQDKSQLPITYPSAKPLKIFQLPKKTSSTIDSSTKLQEQPKQEKQETVQDDIDDEKDERFVFFFDIDNCLYPKSSRIHQLMQKYIHRYFVSHLELDDESAELLHQEYYKDYGLALEGLVRFHHIDALEYNSKVDDALPLEHILKPDPALRLLLESIDRTKVKKLWLFTNAYKNHGLRVVKLLGIDDLFDGITYCDYSKVPLVCKPKEEMFDKVMKEAGVPKSHKSRCLYIDDSYINVEASMKYGWTSASVQYVDCDETLPKKPAGTHVVRSILDLPAIMPEIFTTDSIAEIAHLIAQPEYNTDIDQLMKLAEQADEDDEAQKADELRVANAEKREAEQRALKKLAAYGSTTATTGSDDTTLKDSSSLLFPGAVAAAGDRSILESGTSTPLSGAKEVARLPHEPSTHQEKRQQWQRRYSKQLLENELHILSHGHGHNHNQQHHHNKNDNKESDKESNDNSNNNNNSK